MGQDPVANDLPIGVALKQVTDIKGVPAPIPSMAKGTVLIFVSLECPIANRYAPEMRRLFQAYRSKGIDFRLVYVDLEGKPADFKAHAARRKLDCAILWDPRQTISSAVGASYTPETALMNVHGDVIYRGRIDDRFVDHGQERPAPTRHDLELAIKALLAGREVAMPETETVGCAIPHR